ncbi:UDP-N-acetylmuramoyl-L-alanine--D-glutamate ligase [sulfur-oxidizing endosymbiont of Gigantopelta aegis]|uniref:UDP-N-acetylmuramoyl-L-alanine--D-glutamate ligase n=1 Tax=sulfur-oxidizing endosymbiont of Gigantopelta aegis TaxID=2794934 RepID=UPI0018DB2965|nr:UDP-N-acetylmuramoyl-L-alanine--D-glutamate ligase [sulfur-oxidizing endosymbiont of Gigantopelta aegis]
MNNIAHDKQIDFSSATLIVGMGSTGLSCARYLQARSCPFAFADSRNTPPSLAEVKKQFTPLEILTGDFEFATFAQYKQIIVSPGVSIRSKLFVSLAEKGCNIMGDIEVFAQVVKKPVIAITGSNGKSTVTTLVEKIAQDCGIKTIAGGNLGIPVLDLLSSDSDLYILELSSFQLETTDSLETVSATVLNVSEDHMDRYKSLDDYRQVKESIYHNTQNAIVNSDEKITCQRVIRALDEKQENYAIITFGEQALSDYTGIKTSYFLQADRTLMNAGNEIMSATEIKIKGTYNYLNILAALALLEPLALDQVQQVKAIKTYKGLAHRCEWIASVNDVEFYNDSKGTNTGSTIAAINAFSLATENNHSQKTVILIAGGEGKDADFTGLGISIEEKIKATVLMGVDAELIKISALNAGAKNDSIYAVETMSEAVSTAVKLADSGDVVLFSPACASFDMYKNYMQRGDDFKEKVLALKKELRNAS